MATVTTATAGSRHRRRNVGYIASAAAAVTLSYGLWRQNEAHCDAVSDDKQRVTITKHIDFFVGPIPRTILLGKQ